MSTNHDTVRESEKQTNDHYPGTNYTRVNTLNVFTAKNRNGLDDVPVEIVAGSTFPLVGDGEENNDYNPFEHRQIKHPTTDAETLIHLLKGSLGSGILAMPLAFSSAGLWWGLIATFAVGFICTYTINVLVSCAHVLCRRTQVASLSYADVAEAALLTGPTDLHKYSRLARFLIELFLVADLIGCCCVYNIFVATNMKQIVDHYIHIDPDLRWYIASLLLPLIFINLIRKLKYLAPLSMVANLLLFWAITVTVYYLLIDIPNVDSRPAIVSPTEWPKFFGTVIFALEGIGVVMSLENNMKNPLHFIGCPSVLCIGMTVVVILYALVGFLGYLRFGNETKGSITLNLPVDELLAQSVKATIAVGIFFTYALQFFVPFEIIWSKVKGNFSTQSSLKAEYVCRVILVTFTVVASIIIPDLGPFISLIGAVCLSTLGLMFPAMIELITFWDNFGIYNWKLIKNICLILFGIIGFITGTYVSILEIIEAHHLSNGEPPLNETLSVPVVGP